MSSPLPPIGSLWGGLSPAQRASVPVGTRLERGGSIATKGADGWTCPGWPDTYRDDGISGGTVIVSYPEGAAPLPDPLAEIGALRAENERLRALLVRVSEAWDGIRAYATSHVAQASLDQHAAAHAAIKAALAAKEEG